MDREFIESLRANSEALLKATEAHLRILELLERNAADDKYLSPEAAAAALGGISPEMLVERCRDGRFKYGREFINTSDGKRSNYLIKPSAVRKFFDIDPAKRPPSRRVG